MAIGLLRGIKTVVVDGNEFLWIPKFYVFPAEYAAGEIGDTSVSRPTRSTKSLILSNENLYNSSAYPAFLDADDKERDGFYVAKYRTSLDENGNFVSQKGRTPIVCSHDEANRYSESAILGGHTMTFWEYNALLLVMLIAGGIEKKISPFTPSANHSYYLENVSSVRVLYQSVTKNPARKTALPNDEFSAVTTGDFSIPLGSNTTLCDLGRGYGEHLFRCAAPSDPRYIPSPNGFSLCSSSPSGWGETAASYGGGVTFGSVPSVCFWLNDNVNTDRLSEEGSYFQASATSPVITVGGSAPLCTVHTGKANGNQRTTYTESGLLYDSPLNIVAPSLDKGCFRFCVYEL